MKKTILILTSLIFLLVTIHEAESVSFDFSDWDALIKKYAYKGTKENVQLVLVKYNKLKNDIRFNSLIFKLENFQVNGLETHNERLSFWINAYNIMAVKIVSDSYPVKSIKDIGNWFNQVWNKNAGIIGGKFYSLNDIEHGILRKMGDPRIHTAIVCASISCPDIAMSSYKPGVISSQLDAQSKKFLANESKGFAVNEGEATIYISSIFRWFKKDFEESGGVLNFLERYAPHGKKRYLKFMKSGEYTLKYIDYNWNLNE